jgi:hypothetical protein
MSCGGNNTCQGGQCRPRATPPPPPTTCTTGTCDGLMFTGCNNGVPVAPVSCAPAPGGCQTAICDELGCLRTNLVGGACTFNGVSGTCLNGSCNPPTECTPGRALGCSGDRARQVCNAAGTEFDIEQCPAATPFCDRATVDCVVCSTASQCPTPAEQCSEAVCTPNHVCSTRPKAVGSACDDGNPCNGPDQCGGGTVCGPVGGASARVCPTPADVTCLAQFGCAIQNNAAVCLETPAERGTRCRDANGALGQCNGQGGAGSCVPDVVR